MFNQLKWRFPLLIGIAALLMLIVLAPVVGELARMRASGVATQAAQDRRIGALEHGFRTLVQLRRSVSDFLFEPSDIAQGNLAFAAIEVRRAVDALREDVAGGVGNEFRDRLRRDLGEVELAVESLRALRLDRDRLFPSAPTVRELGDVNAQLATELNFIIENLQAGLEAHPQWRELLRPAQHLRYEWQRMINIHRLLLMASTGFETGSGLDTPVLIENVVTVYESNLLLIRALESDIQLEQDEFPPEVVFGIEEVARLAGNWRVLSEPIYTVALTGHWRQDYPFLSRHLDPAISTLWQSLEALHGSVVHQYSESVTAELRRIEHFGWGVAVVGSLVVLVFAVLGLWLTRRWVIAPLDAMVAAFASPLQDNAAVERGFTSFEMEELRRGFLRMRDGVRERQRSLEHRALHDPLTGLGNRDLFEERLGQMLFDPVCHTSGAVVMIDLDGFKPVNDTYGHGAGDAVLVEIGRRLREEVRSTDVVARLGGDEFALLLMGAPCAEARRLAGKLRESIEIPCEVEGATVRMGASLGVACVPEDGRDPVTLLRHADARMYAEKRRHGSR
ncbi:MAG: GGDEF domain-containing protein [Halothiobacillaceae bacterium]|nr:GGDEF domain-containing protein [Halothiobacillaceae bacterium]